MGKRNSIGLIFSYNENWIGGSYYILNIIRTLKFLEDSQKPKLVIIADTDLELKIVKEIDYPYIEYISLLKDDVSRWKVFFNRVSMKLVKRKIFARNNWLLKFDVLFPARFDNVYSSCKKKLFWIPDFQEHYLPHFFSVKEINDRKEAQTAISKQDYVVFSSKTALQDFNKFYPDSLIKKFVFNFTSILPDIEQVGIEKVLEKYGLTNEGYFFSPNQFWEHKNHIIILKAINKIKAAGKLDFKVYFSGKEYDHRNPEYFESLNQYVKENNLQEDVKFLGFIDRVDQLCLMNNALAVIQPSLFEGWSTVIEDAKAFNQNIIASGLEVHKEQLGQKAYFFDPHDEDALIDQIETVKRLPGKEFDFKYADLIRESAANFNEIIKSIMKDAR